MTPAAFARAYLARLLDEVAALDAAGTAATDPRRSEIRAEIERLERVILSETRTTAVPFRGRR